MRIRRAKKQDLPAINQLCKQTGWDKISLPLINKTDISIVAEIDRQIVGFLWVGRMANGTVGFVDYLVVDEKHRHLGIADKLLAKLDILANKFGMKRLFATIINNDSALYSYKVGCKHGFKHVKMDIVIIAKTMGVN